MNEAVHLNCGAASARLVPGAGGRVSALRLCAAGDGAPVDVLFPYPEEHADPIRWAKGGIYPLLPYSNRIANARVQVQGHEVLLQPHPDAVPHTLHGHAHLLPWRLERHDASSAVMQVDAPAGSAWPWHFTGRLEATLRESELHLQITLFNADTRVMPAGFGLHPYLHHLPDALLAYQASSVWPATADFLATHARAPTEDEQHTLARPLVAGGLTRYAGGWSGRAEVDLPRGACLRIEADPEFGHLVVHRPDNQAYLCLEPVSHVTGGFNLAARGVAATGARLLQPGESMTAGVRFMLLNGQAR